MILISTMNKEKISRQKTTGAHFTPPVLAKFLSKRIIQNLKKDDEKLSLLDPACGDGELLSKFVEMNEKWGSNKLKVIGVEQNKDALTEAKRRLEGLGEVMIQGDFLKFIEARMNNGLFDQNNIPSELEEKNDIIIANPPYVRTQNMGAEKSQELAKVFDLGGKVDLYHAFLIAMTKQLKNGGVMGVITSNRFISTKSGKKIRKFLEENYKIIELIDLGDTKFFDAAVLPAIFIGRKNLEKTGKGKFRKIYEIQDDKKAKTAQTTHNKSELLEASMGKYKVNEKFFEVTIGELLIPEDKKDPWKLITEKERKWMKKIRNESFCRVEDVAKVRVGIKTTADAVFIRENWEDIDTPKPEEELLYPILNNDVVDKWLPKKKTLQKTKVLYTHKKVGGERKVIDLEKYPGAKKYLEKHRERLEGRQYVIDAGRNWYEIWVPQNPEAWKQEKLVCPDISSEPKFCLDRKNSVVNGDCYWITVKNGETLDWLYLIMAVANSKVMTKYHDLAFNNKLYSGRRRYLTQYVKKYPLPDIETDLGNQIVKTVKDIIRGNTEKQKEVEKLIEDAYKI